MYLLSAKTRDLIDAAVSALPDAEQRQIWREWVERHPRKRVPGGPARDDEAPLPPQVALVALTALREVENAKRSRRSSDETSEDELSDLDNDLSYIGAVTRLIQEAARG